MFIQWLSSMLFALWRHNTRFSIFAFKLLQENQNLMTSIDFITSDSWMHMGNWICYIFYYIQMPNNFPGGDVERQVSRFIALTGNNQLTFCLFLFPAEFQLRWVVFEVLTLSSTRTKRNFLVVLFLAWLILNLESLYRVFVSFRKSG